ncbi:hypothetical protein BLNAU_3240 [Blattamonas nauphoetae]|uniref:Uncharacterized protein n=1 Tax=Blattamonas nauphoetae TaxID=2049346 RepID=A0ABQ9YDG3_9EUKA|nr:hypothetical protein BLNAU_3240 [Blattamonas nauphoetae]
MNGPVSFAAILILHQEVGPFYQLWQRLDYQEVSPPSLRINFDETSLLASQAVFSYRVGPATRNETFVQPINQIFSSSIVFFTCLLEAGVALGEEERIQW